MVETIEQVKDETQQIADQEITETKTTTTSTTATSRQSTREKKPQRNHKEEVITARGQQFFQDMNLKTSVLEGHHHDVCTVDMFDKFIVSGG